MSIRTYYDSILTNATSEIAKNKTHGHGAILDLYSTQSTDDEDHVHIEWTIEKAVDIPLENRASSFFAAACVLQIHQFLLLLTILNKLSYDRFSLQENKSLMVFYDKTVCTYLFSVSKSYRSIRQRKLSNHAKLRVQRDVTCLAVCALHCLYLLYFHDFSIN